MLEWSRYSAEALRALHERPPEPELQAAAHGIAPEGVTVVRDPSLTGRATHVVYTRDRLGLIDRVVIVAGPEATAADVRVHALTAREVHRFRGIQGAIHDAVAFVDRRLGQESAPPTRSRAWEAMHEIRKLPRVMAQHQREYEAATSDLQRAKALAQIQDLARQLDGHVRTFAARDLREGRGYIAAEDGAGDTDSSTIAPISNKFPTEDLPTDGRVVQHTLENGLIRITPPGQREFDFVITSNHELVIGRKHHLLGSRGAVLAAGQLKINGRGQITRIDNLSGHYSPTPLEAGQYLEVFRRAGLDLTRTTVDIYDHDANAAGTVLVRQIRPRGDRP